jgi:hypothetical protein
VNRTCPPVLALGTIRLFEIGNLLLLLSNVQGLSVQAVPPVTFSPLLTKTAEALGLTELIKPASVSARVEVEEDGEVTEAPDEVEVTIKLSETDFDILGLSAPWSSVEARPSEAAAVLRERRLLAAGSKPRSSIAEVDRW